MAKIHFLKEGEPSKKKTYILGSQKVYKKIKMWKISFLTSGVINVLCIGYIIYKSFNHH